MADFARGERFKELRLDKHLSQEDAAHAIGVSVKSLRSWENHDGGIKWEHAQSAARVYAVEPESLVTRSRDELGEQISRIEGKLDRVLQAVEPDEAVRAAEDASQPSPASDRQSDEEQASNGKKAAGDERPS